MTTINNPDLLQTLSNASQGLGQQPPKKDPADYMAKPPKPATTQLSSDDELKAAAKRISGGEFRREAPLAINHNGNGNVTRDQPLGQVVNILV